ncbi:MAG TPA: class I SAM-dependent methyltransferase [Vicinamibacterales bacterium]|nr:class I SAM-dependent methyltransferase [Vicinamibacterales bacterium]
MNCIALWNTREAAVSCARGGIDLGFCDSCGAISNQVFDQTRLQYDGTYDNSLHFSPTFQRYAEQLAARLVERHDLRDKDVIDVGCGNGELLALLCRLGNNRGVGFDPSFIPDRSDSTAGKGVTVIPDVYSERYGHYAADLVVCRHVLEHIPEPRPFLRRVRAALDYRARTAVFFEVPNAAHVFQHGGVWDIIYEHCCYYTAPALERLFTACGFDVLDVTEAFSGQYLCLEARPSLNRAPPPAGDTGEPTALREDALRFARSYEATLAEWNARLRRLNAEGRRVAVWGAGAKGAMFLNAFRSESGLDCIVDVNPHKWELHVPGTGQKVVRPDALRQYRPEVVLVMNANYRDEIGRQLSDLGLSPELIAI